MAKGRILVIDSDPFFRKLYQDTLEPEGYYLRAAARGAEAMECLRAEDFDLVITDPEVEAVNGVEITEAVKRFNPDQELLVVTGRQEVGKAVEAMKRGVSEYLLKPINPEEFLLVVNKALFRQSLRVEHKKLVDENIEYLSILSYYQKCLAFLKVHDIDRLGDLILDTLMDLLRAEGGVLWLPGYGGQQYRVRCRRGLVKLAAGEEAFNPTGAERKVMLSGQATLIGQGAAMWVPLLSGLEPVALVRIEAPAGREAFNRRDLKVAGMVAEFAASTLHNVLLYRNLEQSSLRVPRGEAYKMAFFRDHVEKELHKARRYGRNLSFVKLVVENYAELNSHFLDRELEAAMGRLIETVNTALRDADIMAQASPNEFYILLPETDYWGSLVTQKRIRKALRGKLTLCDLKRSYPIRVYLRAGSVPGDGSTFEDLGRAAERRLERLKESLFHRENMEDAPFWPVVARLLGAPADYSFDGEKLQVSSRLAAYEDPQRGRFFRMPAKRLEEIMRSFCRELVESHRVRGIIYRGCDDFERVKQSLRFTEALEKSATSLFLLGGKRRVTWDYQRIVPIFIPDEYFGKISFVLYLNEDYAYALFARRRGDELVGFHTSDFYFVENMITKLQEQYQLQAQI
ncbi:hypothetical protein DESUT3_23190 [Desulfuromonas versatilis]|uniref:Response regulator receiver modulated diguanylate cyclase n=1 Tax=Desulfuromonas versatilis TaxID=2802975 RepID=A0ABN6DYV7_9BACT|nr:response regulator [Desulfuromonas versatilis]BCR05250.1 hypothetical protein DESUT3_23190 [Desulfuromonas versatilis]